MIKKTYVRVRERLRERKMENDCVYCYAGKSGMCEGHSCPTRDIPRERNLGKSQANVIILVVWYGLCSNTPTRSHTHDACILG